MSNPASKGVFISFEGGDGSGKSTQIRKLCAHLRHHGIDVVQTREPGGTDGAEEIRSLVLKGDHSKWDGVTEALLMFASRRDHVVKKIRPALEKGSFVVCDRFADSSMAYQGIGGAVGEDKIDALTDLTVGDLLPDITFILDVPPKIGLGRSKGRQNNVGELRFESYAIEYHEKIREAFLTIARNNPKRCVVLDAMIPIDELHERIVREVASRYPHLDLLDEVKNG